MLKLSNTQRNWVILAVVAWLVILVGLIGIPLTRPAAASGEPKIAPTNSLAAALERTHPTGGAVVAQVINPALVYDANAYEGYTLLCPNEPAEFIDAKLQALQIAERPNLDGEFGYVVLLPPGAEDPVALDAIKLSEIDICANPQVDSFYLDSAMPFFHSDGRWHLGFRQ